MSFGLKEVISSSTVGTLFISLPTGLSSLGITGRIVAIAFFLLAYIAAITSSISLLEVPVFCLMERFAWSRNRSVWLSMILIFLLGLPAVKSEAALDFMIQVFGGLLLVVGGFLLAILLGWVVPRRFDEDLSGCETSRPVRYLLKFMLRWVSPPVIACGLIVSVWDLYLKWFPA